MGPIRAFPPQGGVLDMTKYALISVTVSQDLVYVSCSSPRSISDEGKWFILNLRSLRLSKLRIDWSNHRLRQNCRIIHHEDKLYLVGKCGISRCVSEAHFYTLDVRDTDSGMSETLDSSGDAEFVTNDVFACPVCFEGYKEPKQLSCCGNTICDTCEKRLTTDKKLQCPLCRQIVYVQAGLLPNRALKELLTHLKTPPEPPSAQICYACTDVLKPEKSFYCITCDKDSEHIICGSCGLTHHINHENHVLTKTDFISVIERGDMLDELRIPPNLHPVITSCSSVLNHTFLMMHELISVHKEKERFLGSEFLGSAVITHAAAEAKMEKIKILNQKINKACAVVKKIDQKVRSKLVHLEKEISEIFEEEAEEEK
ncbi:hypothetical protein L596_022395 [Steinernema carpocapsae]|uniref:RING-type domain-containing protein n=1 Tax=Steinernema carpocapsae TaxID=34508 RepID=A0A4U5MLM1_STECR|nr:hypothetical protein L596_022395 [Steinernema carpocapsae]